jgi:hypothetical protein
MDKRQSQQPGGSIPQWGAFARGPLKGWRFSFLQLVKVQQGRVHIDLRCTPPNWPFPTDVRFDPDRDELALLPGPRARLLDLAPMVKLALEHGYVRAAFGEA